MPFRIFVRVCRVCAWGLLLAIAFVTLSPIGLRPHSGASADLERFMALLALGLVFALAYPRHLLAVALLVTAAAIGLELMQALSASRHLRVGDMVVKAGGGLSGIIIGALTLRRRGLQLAQAPWRWPFRR